MNDIKLQSPEGKHPLDENLRPLKVGTTTSPLELSKTDVKVNGSLEVAGDIKGNVTDVTFDDITFDDITCGSIAIDNITIDGTEIDLSSGDLTIDVDGDITLDANGADIYFKDDGTTFATFSKGGSVRLTIASVGDCLLDSGAGIELDAYDGSFVAKKAGTEFSAANSAYAGMILGYTAIGIDATTDSYTVTNAFVVSDATHKITFVAPPSGNVEIYVSVYGDQGSTGRYLLFGLSDNATYNALDVTHEHYAAKGDETDEEQIHHQWVITGLTAGTSYEYWLGAKAQQTGAWILRWGGDATTEYQPFVMKATALPATIYTG